MSIEGEYVFFFCNERRSTDAKAESISQFLAEILHEEATWSDGSLKKSKLIKMV
jgi:hypothetical protein